MPLVYQHNIGECAQLAVWDVTETELLPPADLVRGPLIRRPEKLRQHRGARKVLQHLQPTIALESILYSSAGRPYLAASEKRFSVSHAGNRVGAIFSASQEVGFDLEWISQKALTLSPKFLTESDWRTLHHASSLFSDASLATLGWSMKESLFKWYSLGQVDFKRDLQLTDLAVTGGYAGQFSAQLTALGGYMLQGHFIALGDCWLTWVVGRHPTLTQPIF